MRPPAIPSAFLMPDHRATVLGLAVVAILVTGAVMAAPSADADMAWGTMTMGLLGGLALFLFGMNQMSDSLKAVAGERMKLILEKLTTNRFMGAATGAFVTAVIQSSSVTTVLVVGFISAGLMSMSQSISVIMGANIGTTITAQIIAFKVTKAALAMIAIGFAMNAASKHERTRQYGAMLMGLGLVFFGMSVMSDAMKPLRTYQPFLDLMTTMETPLVGILVAAAFTGLVQSSSATTGIVIVMASQGFITLPTGIALAFGANIGTCVTAMLASIGKPREAVRAALVHVLFNVLGVVVWLGFISHLAELVTWFSPAHPELAGTDRLAAESPRQIANAHTVFNVSNTVLFIWFTGPFARLVEWLIPDRPMEEETALIRARYLDDELLSTPSLALDRARLEVLHAGEHVLVMLGRVMPALHARDGEAFSELARMDDQVDVLHEKTIEYLGKIGNCSLTEAESDQFITLLDAANNLENIGDVIETDLVGLGHKLVEGDLRIDDRANEVLTGVHGAVLRSVDAAIQSVAQGSEAAAGRVTSMKDEITRLADAAALQETRLLGTNDQKQLAVYAIEIDIIEKFKRIYYFSKRMAKTVSPGAVVEEAA